MGGVVSALKLRNTKKGDRYGSFNFEDKSGFIEVIAWPDIYRKSVELLNADDPIFVKGRMEVGEDRMQIFANEIIPLAQEVSKARMNGGANGKTNGNGDPSTRAPAMAEATLSGFRREVEGYVLSEPSESKGDGTVAPGLSAGLYRVHLYVRESEVSADELVQLRETLLEYQGPCVVSLHLFARR